METLSSIQRLGGDVELAVGLSTVQRSRVFEVVNKIQIHAPLELSVLRTAAPLELSPHRSAPRVHSRSHRSALVFLTVLLVFLTVILSAVVLRRACHLMYCTATFRSSRSSSCSSCSSSRSSRSS